MECKRGFVFEVEDDVDDGGEAVFEGVLAGGGFSLYGGGAFGFGSVEAGLLGAGEFFLLLRVRGLVFVGHGVGVPFLATTVDCEDYR